MLWKYTSFMFTYEKRPDENQGVFYSSNDNVCVYVLTYADGQHHDAGRYHV